MKKLAFSPIVKLSTSLLAGRVVGTIALHCKIKIELTKRKKHHITTQGVYHLGKCVQKRGVAGLGYIAIDYQADKKLIKKVMSCYLFEKIDRKYIHLRNLLFQFKKNH